VEFAALYTIILAIVSFLFGSSYISAISPHALVYFSISDVIAASITVLPIVLSALILGCMTAPQILMISMLKRGLPRTQNNAKDRHKLYTALTLGFVLVFLPLDLASGRILQYFNVIVPSNSLIVHFHEQISTSFYMFVLFLIFRFTLQNSSLKTAVDLMLGGLSIVFVFATPIIVGDLLGSRERYGSENYGYAVLDRRKVEILFPSSQFSIVRDMGAIKVLRSDKFTMISLD
jgi:hypothetical protein